MKLSPVLCIEFLYGIKAKILFCFKGDRDLAATYLKCVSRLEKVNMSSSSEAPKSPVLSMGR